MPESKLAAKSVSIPERAREIAANRERYARRRAERFLKSATLQCYRLGGDTLELAKVIVEVMRKEREAMKRQVSAMLQWGGDERTCEEMLKFLREGGK